MIVVVPLVLYMILLVSSSVPVYAADEVSSRLTESEVLPSTVTVPFTTIDDSESESEHPNQRGPSQRKKIVFHFEGGNFHTPWEWQNTPVPSEATSQITFKTPFISPPTVLTSVSSFDMRGDKPTIATDALTITNYGFQLKISSYTDIKLFGGGASWIAFGNIEKK